MSGKTKELKKKIEELELQLKRQKGKEDQEKEQDYGLWEYDILNKRLIQSRKLDGQWNDSSLVVENYREQVKEWNLIFLEDWPIFDAYCDSMDRGDAHFAYELRAMSDDAKFIWLRYEGNTVCDENDKPIKVMGCTIDITDEKQERERLEKQVSRDLLTGLYTKEIAMRMIEKALPMDRESKGALVLIDIDDFKVINDKYGRLYGDALLETISGIIYTHFRAKDIVSRIDGDEFLVYCSGLNDEKGIQRLIEKLMVRFQEFVVDRDGNKVGISAGIAMYPEDGECYSELEDKAVMALSCAKQRGKNQYVIYDPTIEAVDLKEAARSKHREKSWRDSVSVKRLENSNKDLFDFAFDVICREKNFYDALQTIFKEVSLCFSLDRSTLMEYVKGSGRVAVTVEWSREADGDDVRIMESSSSHNWPILERIYHDRDYCIMNYEDNPQESFIENVKGMNKIPITAIQIPIMDQEQMTGALTFESWTKREWNRVEISTLSSIAKMITSYLLCLQTKTELETEYIAGKKAMDVQNLTYYVVDGKNHEISYMSHLARETHPMVKYGQKCYEAFKGRMAPCSECPIPDCTEKNNYTNTIELYESEEDSWYTIIASKMGKGGDLKYMICQSDVTTFLERVKGEDQLTGVMSYEKFRLEAVRALKKGKDGYMLAFVGIQDFSRINDDYGYEVGDQVLKTYADLMRRNVSENEFLCRIKGDDFAVLLKERPVDMIKEQLQQHSRRMTEIFRDRFPNISINCFGGVYFISDSLEHISRCLDKAMKARKVVMKNFYETGGMYTYTRDFELQEKEKEDMNRALKESLEKGFFKVFFQPKVDVVTDEIIGAEALVRLIDKNNQLVSPGKFIPLAEESGLIVEIDKFVYEETFKRMSQWMQEGKHMPLISVNLSRLHLLHDGFPEMIKAMTDKYGLKPQQVELEITESVFFEDTERLVSMIKRIKDLGYIISMDDFGAGFSTLSLMKTLPIDVIKLDGSFFLKNKLDPKNKAVISAIMQLAQNLQFETVSEGVETREQLEFIKEQGGRCVQGFYFYKPMPAEDFEKLLV